MALTRRDLLRQGGVALGASALMSRLGMLTAMAQSTGDDYKALVCIYLDGGNDAYNMIAPRDSDAAGSEYAYYRSKRPRVGVPFNDLLGINPGDGGHAGRTFGMHPNLGTTSVTVGSGTVTSEGLYPLWQQGRLAVVCNVGTLKYPIDRNTYVNNPASRPASLYDHRVQKETWQDLSLGQGWGNSLAGLAKQLHTNPRLPMLVNVTGGSSLYLTGTEPYITVQNNGANLIVQTGQAAGQLPTGSRYAALRQLQVYGMSDNLTLVQGMSDRVARAIDNGEEAFTALAGTTTATPFPFGTTNGLATQLSQIARIIGKRDTLGTNRRQIFFASTGGFDTHSGQLVSQPTLMRSLSQAMKWFYDEIAAQGLADKVTTFTLSEFGRTFQENSDTNVGTDHAWGSHALILGDAVRGGWFYGQYPPIAGIVDPGSPYNVDSGRSGRFIPTTSVDEYAATLASWFGVRDVDIQAIMPNVGNMDRPRPPYLGFMH